MTLALLSSSSVAILGRPSIHRLTGSVTSSIYYGKVRQSVSFTTPSLSPKSMEGPTISRYGLTACLNLSRLTIKRKIPNFSEMISIALNNKLIGHPFIKFQTSKE